MIHQNQELYLRTLTGILMVVGILSILSMPAPYLFALLTTLAGVMLAEWNKMVGAKSHAYTAIIMAISIAGAQFDLTRSEMIPLLCLTIGYLMWQLRPQHFRLALAGYVYISLSMILLIYSLPSCTFAQKIAIFSIIWISDTAAFIVGKTFKGPKLAPKISPNKTWSGLLGGYIVTTAIVLWLYFYRPVDFGFKSFYLLLVAIAIVTPFGDLVESYAKRIFKVKDSGNILPGHGGVLDRFDSLIAASYMLAIWKIFG